MTRTAALDADTGTSAARAARRPSRISSQPETVFEPTPRWVRRGLAAVAAVALVPEAQRLWKAAVRSPLSTHGHLLSPQTTHSILLVAAIAAFGALLVAVAAAAGAHSDRGVERVGLTLLAVGGALVLGEFALSHSVNDEGALTAKAADALLHGHRVYGVDWPGLFGTHSLTKTMGGGGDYTYGYPPLAVLLTAVLAAVLHSPTLAASLVTMASFLVVTVVLWIRVTSFWRPLVVVVMLALEPIEGSASGGSPILVAIALLLPVLLRFDRTGAQGRLGRTGVVKAACLGAACAAQQLAWFVVPFIAVVLYGLRAREVGHRAAALVVGRYLATAGVVWLLIDLPFILTQPFAWFQGIVLPLAQHAIVHGQGISDIPYLLTGGSGAVDLFSAATAALFAGLLLGTSLFPGRLGPAFVILPFTVFYVATRFDYAYSMQLSPLWLATLATVPIGAFRNAWRPRWMDSLPSGAKAAIVVALTAPPVVLALLGAFLPPSLQLHLDSATSVPGARSMLGQVEVTAVNVSDHVVAPHFSYLEQGGTSSWWEVLHGPQILRPGQQASYTLEPVQERQKLVGGAAIIAVSDEPMTISSVPLPGTLAGD